jgi:hypothetical protein
VAFACEFGFANVFASYGALNLVCSTVAGLPIAACYSPCRYDLLASRISSVSLTKGGKVSIKDLVITPTFSSSWLMIVGREEESLTTLARLHARGNENDAFVQEEFKEMRLKVREEANAESAWRQVRWLDRHTIRSGHVLIFTHNLIRSSETEPTFERSCSESRFSFLFR